MKKEFFLNIVFLILANILIKPFYLLWIEVEVNNIVGPSQYGIYAGIFSLCYIFQIVADPGLLNYNTTQIAADRQKVFSRVSEMIGLKLFLALFYIAVIYIIAYISGYGSEQWTLLPWIVGNLLLISFNLFLRSNISAIGQYRWDSLFSILDKLLMIVILAYMIYFASDRESFAILDFVKGQMTAYVITCFILALFLGLKNIKIIPSFKLKTFRSILKESIPYAWLLFLMTIYTRVDSFMLERLLDDHGYEAGVYASAFRLFDAGNSFAYLFAVLLLPIFSYLLAKKESILSLLTSASSLLFSGVVSVGIFAVFWSDEIMEFFYPTDATKSYGLVFIWLMLALIPLAMAYVTGSLLTADNRLKELNRMAIVGVVINIALNAVFIQKYQAVGASVATVITQTLMTIIQLGYVIYFFKIKVKWIEVLKYAVFAILAFIFAFLLREYSPLESWVNFVSGIIICIISAFFLGLIQIDFFKTMLRSKMKQN